MTRAGRFSIGLLMAVVFLVAADFALVRAVWASPGPASVVAVTTLPTINLLILALPRLVRGGDDGAYWRGFEAAGWATVGLFGVLGWCFTDAFFYPIGWLRDRGFFPLGSPPSIALLITFAILFYTTPLVLAAWLGGRLGSRGRRSGDGETGPGRESSP